MTAVEVPTSLAVMVAAYVAGAYFSGFVYGWTAPRWQSKPDDIDWLAMVGWPFAALVGVAKGLAAVCRFAARRFPSSVKWASHAWLVLTLPLRSWRLGRMLRERRSR